MELLTIKEVAKILRLHPNRVLPLIRSGKLPARDIGASERRAVYRVSREDLDAFLEESRVEPRG